MTKKERRMEKDYELLEDNLEKELELSRIQMECESNDFEQSLRSNDKLDYNGFLEEDKFMDKLCELLTGNKYVDYVLKIEGSIKKNKDNIIKKFNFFTRNIDIINNVYLKMELDSSFEELSSEEKYAILDSDIEFTIGGSIIDKIKLLSCLFHHLCLGKSIIEKDNIIQIPIYDFNSLLYKATKNGNRFGNLKGLPLVAIYYHEICFSLFSPKILSNFKINLVLEGKIIDTPERKDMALNNDLEFLVFQNNIYEHKEKYYNNINLRFNNQSKFMLIYFKPKVFTSTNFWDLSLEYPQLENAKLNFNGGSLDFSDEDGEILSFEFFGITIYLLPYSNDVDTWEKIKESFGNIYENFNHSFINFSRLDNVKLNLDISGNKENFYIVINNINFNIIHFKSGMAGLKFVR